MIGLRKLALLSFIISIFVSAHPLASREENEPEPNVGRYIVTLRDGLGATAVEEHIRRATNMHALDNSPAVEIGRRWNIGSWNAYSCTMDSDVRTQIGSDNVVEMIEPDGEINLMKHVVQQDASWGLADLSHRVPNNSDYIYDSRAGEGTYAYVLDTGLLNTHEEFENRASLGHNVVGGIFADEVGHGTHVAGTIADKTYGVAKKAKVISVKIFANAASHTSDLLEGIHWAVQDIITKKRQNSSVINISAVGYLRESVNRAVEEAYKRGVLIVVAAGNYNQDARNYSPASASAAITVGSVGRDHTRSHFSDWGELVDIFAPGEHILSAWIQTDQDTASLSGTSMSTPHVSGLILYLKSLVPYQMKTPRDSLDVLRRLATDGAVRDPHGSKNFLAYNGNGVAIFTGDLARSSTNKY
ncbi:oryzin precursor [Daldinia caldariorum]|uniref:oryzin precursor n=1 Tax=Daldinia caldariorum TaxID=326644 RepID=UPI0020089DCF|nr:oryzin precursor [Daldinia caldariorum]KAI1471781.1 oryzin precursor [Daldinia caldariorum]